MTETNSKNEERAATSAVEWRRALPRWIQVALLVAVFVAGGAVGSALTARTIFSRMETYRKDAAIFSSDIALRLRVRLRLNQDQATQIQKILERRHSLMIDHRDAGARMVHTEFDSMVGEVGTVLDDVQIDRWREISNAVRTTFLPTFSR